jgi:hypothetical protein
LDRERKLLTSVYNPSTFKALQVAASKMLGASALHARCNPGTPAGGAPTTKNY